MKKFYYRKEDSLDKTPIILRLDRRHTVNVNKDGVKEEIGRISSRATSISSLDQLKDIPTLPRARIREGTKSLSEDIFNNSIYSAPSTVVITETELSSSWLYKKAVADSRKENENRTPKASRSSRSSTAQQSLSPVMLKDPKMKPVPVRNRSRIEKPSSFCCYMAIIVIITICTLGFMSTIGGIIYLEVFSIKDPITNTTETRIDTLDVLRRDQAEDANRSTEHMIEKIVVNDIEKISSKKDESEEFKDSITIDEDNQRKAIHFLDFGKPISTELTQFIDNTRTRIRLHKEDSARYEENSSNSFKYDESSNFAGEIANSQSNDLYKNHNEIEKNSNQSENNMTEVINDKLNNNFENLEEILINQSKDYVAVENEEKEINVESTKEIPHLDQPDNFKQSESDIESKSEVSILPIKQEPGSETDLQKLKYPSIVNNDAFAKDNLPTDPSFLLNPSDQEKHVVQQFNASLERHIVKDTDESEIKPHEIEEKHIFVEEEVVDNQPDESNKDESIITVVSEPIKEILSEESKVFSNRNGDVSPSFESFNSRATVKPIQFKIGSKRPVFSSVGFRDKPLKKFDDMKVSLAEAMKQLQVLDAKLPSSRTKSVKPKVKKNTPKPQTNMKLKMGAMEQMRYLQKLRILMLNQMQ